jgi:hypothetical protein
VADKPNEQASQRGRKNLIFFFNSQTTTAASLERSMVVHLIHITSCSSLIPFRPHKSPRIYSKSERSGKTTPWNWLEHAPVTQKLNFTSEFWSTTTQGKKKGKRTELLLIIAPDVNSEE